MRASLLLCSSAALEIDDVAEISGGNDGEFDNVVFGRNCSGLQGVDNFDLGDVCVKAACRREEEGGGFEEMIRIGVIHGTRKRQVRKDTSEISCLALPCLPSHTPHTPHKSTPEASRDTISSLAKRSFVILPSSSTSLRALSLRTTERARVAKST